MPLELFQKWMMIIIAKEHMTQDLVTCLFLCVFALLYFRVGELACDCVPACQSGQKLENRFGGPRFFCLIGK